MTLCDRYWRGMAGYGIYPDFRSMWRRNLDAWESVRHARGFNRQFREALAAKSRIEQERGRGEG